MSNESFVLNPGESKISRFSAGEHEIIAESFLGDTECVRIKVEDALKFGGSDRKRCYVFDENPWAIIVMKDRTYFFNEKTGEQFVEHTLSPNNIEELTDGYLLFSTEHDISIYSLETMTVEETISNVKIEYSGKNHCVFSGDKKLIVYRLYPQAIGNRKQTIECDSFVIQDLQSKGEGIIRYHQKDAPMTIKTLRVLSTAVDDVFEKEDSLELKDEFVCFSGQQSVLLTRREGEENAPKSLFCLFLNSSRLVTVCNCNKPISSVNDIKLWENKVYNQISNDNVEGEASDVRVDVVESKGYVSHISTTYKTVTTKRNVTRRGETLEVFNHTTIICSILYDEIGKEIVQSSHKLSFQHNGSIDSVSNGSKVYIIDENGIQENEGELLINNCGIPYVVRKKDNTYSYFTIKGERIIDKGQRTNPFAGNRTSPSFGLFYQGEGRYYWLKTEKVYVGNDFSDFSISPKPVIVSGGRAGRVDIRPRFFMRTGDVFPVPVPNDEIIALSQYGKAVLYEKGGSFGIARYSNRDWTYKTDIHLSIYDTLHVKDAVFCSDGAGFIYQKKNKLVLYDFSTQKETEFDTDKGIRNNVNGYRPYCTKDYFSRPVIVDPISRRTIDHNFLSQYRFSNSGGDVFFVKRDYRYFLRDGYIQISKEEYDAYCREYDYPHNPFGLVKTDETKSEKRKQYLQSVGRKMSSGPFGIGMPHELTVSNFVDQFIVKTQEVAVINRRGINTDVPIGDPLYYLNYVAFSADSKQVAIAGKYRDASGLCVVYDMENGKVLHRSTLSVGKTKAIWLASFSKNGIVAYYDSSPNTYFLKNGESLSTIPGRSFLTFSPTGKYVAFSKQGYIPWNNGEFFWGHVPSCDVYIARTDAPGKSLCHYNDHGAGIVGTAVRRETVATASFSSDESKILSVSNDGVVVVRNLHLE